ncbi:hypothetical protein HERIO_2757 [Hepatospora eriocheir]|uniref:Uncharacterized protein n=1 Tax=Hepatospora eriocheir TaxID=1081669 RepID=A0A1X0QC95_9MICR|nr:hypothetical protein HERIO_2757 [Hepatospora eriocheir]
MIFSLLCCLLYSNLHLSLFKITRSYIKNYLFQLPYFLSKKY